MLCFKRRESEQKRMEMEKISCLGVGRRGVVDGDGDVDL